jgi:hypothetical protein
MKMERNMGMELLIIRKHNSLLEIGFKVREMEKVNLFKMNK